MRVYTRFTTFRHRKTEAVLSEKHKLVVTYNELNAFGSEQAHGDAHHICAPPKPMRLWFTQVLTPTYWTLIGGGLGSLEVCPLRRPHYSALHFILQSHVSTKLKLKYTVLASINPN